MRKQDHEIHGYDLYNAFKRSPVSNDWHIIPIIILFALAVGIMIIGADRVIDVMSDFIVGIRAK